MRNQKAFSLSLFSLLVKAQMKVCTHTICALFIRASQETIHRAAFLLLASFFSLLLLLSYSIIIAGFYLTLLLLLSFSLFSLMFLTLIRSSAGGSLSSSLFFARRLLLFPLLSMVTYHLCATRGHQPVEQRSDHGTGNWHWSLVESVEVNLLTQLTPRLVLSRATRQKSATASLLREKKTSCRGIVFACFQIWSCLNRPIMNWSSLSAIWSTRRRKLEKAKRKESEISPMALILLPVVDRWNTGWSTPTRRLSLVPFPCSNPTFHRKLLIRVGRFSLNWPINSIRMEIYQSIRRWSFSVRWIKFGNRFNVHKCHPSSPRPPTPPPPRARVHRRKTTTIQMKTSTWIRLSVHRHRWTKRMTTMTRTMMKKKKQENARVVAETNIIRLSTQRRTVTTTINSKPIRVHNAEKWDRDSRGWTSVEIAFSSSRCSRLSTISFDICPCTPAFVHSSARYDTAIDIFCFISLSLWALGLWQRFSTSIDTLSTQDHSYIWETSRLPYLWQSLQPFVNIKYTHAYSSEFQTMGKFISLRSASSHSPLG